MKLICTQENLRRVIAVAERAVGRQGTLPILGNFLLETENGRLKLSATNLEIGVVARVGAKVESEGRITIPAKLLSSFIANLPAGETVTLEKKEGLALSITAGQYQVKIKGQDAQEFPIIPQSKGGPSLLLPAAALRSALGRLLPCVALNEARLELTGVNVIFSEDRIVLAATDSFRLAEESVFLEKDTEQADLDQFVAQGSCIVPASTLVELVRVVGPESHVIRLIAEENQLFFEVDGVQIISRLVSGKFPDYQQIIPTEFRTRIIVEKEQLLRAVRIASVFTSQGVQEIVLKIYPENQQLLVESRSQEIGENRTSVPVDVIGTEPLELVFNPRYLIDGINAIATKKLVFLANESVSPVAIKAVDDQGTLQDAFVYIIMPIRN